MSSVVTVTGKGARFVQLLHDFGHLDEETTARVLHALEEEVDPDEDLADLDEVRRAAARILFERDNGLLEPVLAEDWPLLFS